MTDDLESRNTLRGYDRTFFRTFFFDFKIQSNPFGKSGLHRDSTVQDGDHQSHHGFSARSQIIS